MGDSILRQLQFSGPTHPNSNKALTRSIQDEGWRASVRAENGWITEWVRRLARYAANHRARGIIIVSGINDTSWIRHQPNRRKARQRVATQINATLHDIRRTDCVVWPTIPSWGHPSGKFFNRQLLRQEARRPDLTVPRWGAEFGRHPGYSGRDGMHLSRRGEAAFQRMLLGAMRDCMGPVGAAEEVTPTTVPSNTGPAAAPPTTATTTPPTTTTATPPTTTTTAPPTTTTSRPAAPPGKGATPSEGVRAPQRRPARRR